MNVGAAIYACRLKRGLTQQELARRALMTPANLSAIETGRRDLTVQTLLRLARTLNTSGSALLAPSAVLRSSLPHDTFNRLADAVRTGKRPFTPELNQLADAVAWNARPILDAVGAPGFRRGSHRAARLARLVWSHQLLDWLFRRVKKLAASDAGRIHDAA